MLNTKPIVKDDGFGPYLYVMSWKHSRTGELMSSVFSTWDDLEQRRRELAHNHIETTWDLAVDYLRYQANAS